MLYQYKSTDTDAWSVQIAEEMRSAFKELQLRQEKLVVCHEGHAPQGPALTQRTLTATARLDALERKLYGALCRDLDAAAPAALLLRLAKLERLFGFRAPLSTDVFSRLSALELTI